MNKLEMKQQATEIAREAARQASITRTTSVMHCIPDLLGAVEIDAEYMRSHVETVLNKKSANPIRELLRLMGLRIVSTRNAAESLGLDDEMIFTVGYDASDRSLESMLKINQNSLAVASGKVAAELAEIEGEHRAEQQSSRGEHGRIFAELDKTTQEFAQLRADFVGQQRIIMDHAQYMLALIGKENSDSPVGQQIVEMLEDMGIRVYWTAEGAPFSDSAMFSELKCENPEQHNMKPCLASGESVLMKGTRFVSKAAD